MSSENTHQAEIVAIRKIPVLSYTSPDWPRVPLGVVSAECVTAVYGGLEFSGVIDTLESMLAAQAVEKFNGSARAVFNFSWTYEERWPERIYRATADAYGDEIEE